MATFKDKFKNFQNLAADSGITLRQVDPERDFDDYFAIYSDHDLFRYYEGGPRPGLKPETVRVILNNQIKEFNTARIYSWTIADENDRALGRILLSDFEHNNKTANIGYFLARNRWNQGIMTACIKSVAEFGFAYLELERIYSTVHVDNTASWRALEKNRFAREGLMRHAFNLPCGLCDCYLYARLSTD
ncbi:MAG: GNAT family N-acetyltransferase [Clostridia bacterium]|nr:GNAT family N-acetyltransferase [Clostridia bacterium]